MFWVFFFLFWFILITVSNCKNTETPLLGSTAGPRNLHQLRSLSPGSLQQAGPDFSLFSRLLGAGWKTGTRGGRFYSEKSIRETAWHADSKTAKQKNQRQMEKCVQLACNLDSGSDTESVWAGCCCSYSAAINERCMTSNRRKLPSFYSGRVLAPLLWRQNRSLMVALIPAPPTRRRLITLKRKPTVRLQQEYWYPDNTWSNIPPE